MQGKMYAVIYKCHSKQEKRDKDCTNTHFSLSQQTYDKLLIVLYSKMQELEMMVTPGEHTGLLQKEKIKS